ncbi:MAG: diheme cytochrome c [Gammaproteobacteria bacterium]|jgi:hypothetical protein
MKYFTISVIALTGLLLLSIQVSFGDDDHDERGEYSYALLKRKPGVAPVENALYQEECSSCHFPYQPGLLPENSWRKIMSGLDDHFGENAELGDVDRKAIEQYLVANSADKSGLRRSKRIMRSVSASDAPLRITELPYFKHEHHEIPKRLVKDNPKVGSFSQCDSCHQDAKQGYFSENRITIPGYGRWDD